LLAKYLSRALPSAYGAWLLSGSGVVIRVVLLASI